MKNIIVAFSLAMLLMTPSYADDKKQETKKVCVDKRDAKGEIIKKADGKPVQECKEMKVHKKLEGTEVPPKK